MKPKATKKVAKKKTVSKEGYDSFMTDKQGTDFLKKHKLKSAIILGVNNNSIEVRSLNVEPREAKYYIQALSVLKTKTQILAPLMNFLGTHETKQKRGKS